jgi:phage tail-like protein
MRAGLPELSSPVPVIGLMPSIFQEDPFAQQFCHGLDDVLAPIFATLDCLDAYVDPDLAPEDFLDWLGSWVGVMLIEDWPIERKRALIARSVSLFRLRGTVAGLREELELHTGGEVQIIETGGVVWSQTPGTELPGKPVPRVAVRVIVDDPATVKEAWVNDIVASSKPAHVVHQVEVVGRGTEVNT